jgi:uncharacterized protein YkwD
MKDFLHHFFVPRESNNHRARLLHAEPLFLLIVILLVINFMTPRVSQRYPSVLGITANISIEDLVRMTNERRAEAGLAPLVLNPQLSQAATAKAHYMFDKNFWAHNAPDGTTPWVFIKSSGYEYIYAGENLARGFNTAGDAMNAWMASPGHRENIMSPNYNEIGFSVATGSLTGEDTILIVEMFGSRSTDVAHVGTSQQLIPPTTVPTVAIAAVSPVVAQAVLPSVQPTNAIVTIPPIAATNPSVSPEQTVPPSPYQLLQTNVVTVMPNGSSYYVAGLSTKPLIDKNVWSRILTLFIAGLFILLFFLDFIIIERKQVVRIVSHNLDHLLFLGIILLAILLFNGKGVL